MELLTTAEVAARLRVSIATVNRWARLGLLRAVDLPGRTRRYRAEDVDALIAAGENEVAAS